MKKKSQLSLMTILLVYYGVNITVNMLFSLFFSRMYPLLRTVQDHSMIREVYKKIGFSGMIIAFTSSIVLLTVYIWPVMRDCWGKTCNEPTPQIQDRVLALPFVSALMSIVGWFIVIANFYFTLFYHGFPLKPGYLVRFTLDMSLIGVSVFVLHYYIFEFFNRRTLIPYFFPDNVLSRGRKTKSTVRSRFRIYYFAVTLFPLFLFYSIFLSKLPEYIGIITVVVCLIVLLTSLLTYLIANTYQQPLDEMEKATLQIRNENYDVYIPVRSNDEVGRLSESINTMAQELKEKAFIKETFGKIVDPAVRDYLLAGNIFLGGEKKQAAVLFADIRNFTEMSENNQPAEVVQFLNYFFNTMSAKIEESGGIINKYIGDAIFALFGVPIESPLSENNAVSSAVKMMREMKRINSDKSMTTGLEIEIGIGVHSGEILAGNIGSDSRMEYTAIGDAVNLASRVESLTKLYGVPILVTDAVVGRCPDNFTFKRIDTVQVKGKKQAVTLYDVLDWCEGEEREQRESAVEEYSKALDLYFAGNFDEAKKSFEQLKEGPYSTASALMAGRCQHYQQFPPQEDWNGETRINEK